MLTLMLLMSSFVCSNVGTHISVVDYYAQLGMKESIPCLLGHVILTIIYYFSSLIIYVVRRSLLRALGHLPEMLHCQDFVTNFLPAPHSDFCAGKCGLLFSCQRGELFLSLTPPVTCYLKYASTMYHSSCSIWQPS